MSERNLYPMKIVPLTKPYVWGGVKLKPYFNDDGVENSPLAEAWLIGEDNVISNGFLAGRTLLEVSREYGISLLGESSAKNNNNRFPLLIKILDCAQWLSLQVHPNDEQAVQLEGPDFSGKTEAWYVLEAEPGASLIAGLKPGITRHAMEDTIRNGNVMELVQCHPLFQSDTIFIGAGTVHALGPGILVYEVQQMSDLTYRIYDWDRPQTGGRLLHIEKSLEVIDPDIEVSVIHHDPTVEPFSRSLVQCKPFVLEGVASVGEPIQLDTKGKSFDVLTVIEGETKLTVGKHQLTLGKYESVLIPASCGAYQIEGKFRALKANTQ